MKPASDLREECKGERPERSDAGINVNCNFFFLDLEKNPMFQFFPIFSEK